MGHERQLLAFGTMYTYPFCHQTDDTLSLSYSKKTGILGPSGQYHSSLSSPQEETVIDNKNIKTIDGKDNDVVPFPLEVNLASVEVDEVESKDIDNGSSEDTTTENDILQEHKHEDDQDMESTALENEYDQKLVVEIQKEDPFIEPVHEHNQYAESTVLQKEYDPKLDDEIQQDPFIDSLAEKIYAQRPNDTITSASTATTSKVTSNLHNELKSEIETAKSLILTDPLSAENICDSVTKLEPENASAWICLGEARLLLHVTRLDVMNPFLDLNQGSVTDTDRLSLAKVHFETAISLDPMDSRARANLDVALLLSQSSQQDATTHLSKFCEQKKENNDTAHFASLYNTALMHLSLKDPQAAVSLLSQVLASHPDLVPARFNLASALLSTEDTAQAKDILQTLMHDIPCHMDISVETADATTTTATTHPLSLFNDTNKWLHPLPYTNIDTSIQHQNQIQARFCSILHNNLGTAYEKTTTSSSSTTALLHYQVALHFNPNNEAAQYNYRELIRKMSSFPSLTEANNTDSNALSYDCNDEDSGIDMKSRDVESKYDDNFSDNQDSKNNGDEIVNNEVWDDKQNKDSHSTAKENMVQDMQGKEQPELALELVDENESSYSMMAVKQAQENDNTSSFIEKNLEEISEVNSSSHPETAEPLQETEPSFVDASLGKEQENFTEGTSIFDSVEEVPKDDFNSFAADVSEERLQTEEQTTEQDIEVPLQKESNAAIFGQRRHLKKSGTEHKAFTMPTLHNAPLVNTAEKLSSMEQGYMKSGDAYMVEENCELASDQFQKVIEMHPNYLPALMRHAAAIESMDIEDEKADSSQLESRQQEGSFGEIILRRAAGLANRVKKEQDKVHIVKQVGSLVHLTMLEWKKTTLVWGSSLAKAVKLPWKMPGKRFFSERIKKRDKFISGRANENDANHVKKERDQADRKQHLSTLAHKATSQWKKTTTLIRNFFFTKVVRLPGKMQ